MYFLQLKLRYLKPYAPSTQHLTYRIILDIITALIIISSQVLAPEKVVPRLCGMVSESQHVHLDGA